MERNKTTKKIGEPVGRMLIFGGVYSNLPALTEMRRIAEELEIPPSRVICTGDVVGYCAEPEATVQAVMDWDIHCIAGNVEIQLREGEQDCGCDFNDGSRCDIFSRQWYPFAQSQMSEASLKWMQDLPDFIRFEWEGKKMVVVHGSYFETSGYVFASTPWETKDKNLRAADADVILAGHCGLPFYTEHEGDLWINPGVIGMPANDGTTRVWYTVIEPDGSPFFSHQSFEYDHTSAAKRMRELSLPAAYALTLETGLWDNCEILPPEETAAQGTELVF